MPHRFCRIQASAIRTHEAGHKRIMKATQLLQNQAYDYLSDMIKKGELKAGEIYSLNQMAQTLGISKTPLRDAVLRLEQERYIDLFPSRGFMLHQMTNEDIIETYQIRHAIELFCSKQMTRGLDTQTGQAYFAKLQSKIERQKEIIQTTHSSEDFGRSDYEFHRSIVQSVGNKSMLEIYRSFMYRIFWQNVTSFQREGRMEETIEEHIAMLERIKNKDIDGLEKLLDHHLSVAQNINLELIK